MDTDTITRQPANTHQAARDKAMLRDAGLFRWIVGTCQTPECRELGVLVEDEHGHAFYACPEDQGVDTNPVTED